MTDQVPQQDELTVLKNRATAMGIAFHPNIGVDKLREKVNAALTESAPEQDAPATDSTSGETAAQRRARLKREASKLIRVRVTCMNPLKREHEGEIFTAGNAMVGSFKKYVPFNADDGWHIPQIIYNQLTQRQCQVFYTERDARGNTTRKGKLIREFNVEVLPPLTEAELKELAQRQAMARSVD
ncbi:hypothetical protein [Larsenimonas suaedae]|uniref:Uncharacterized protein n=1 Tax=Larsenimonas suaedae TaxID=1851019 RepID=A0ABU1GYX8_9GAMM|nr:hypothetical protein [Larsenimonas suaedae]MCM2973728.1 hypothetical protein [Larsenimonas suaedae]MDR5897251.1 hypothetical protein [Larsenimonas suaedae]